MSTSQGAEERRGHQDSGLLPASEPKEAKRKGRGGNLLAPGSCAPENGLLWGFPRHESSSEEGIPEPFLLPCQVSFLQHRLNFLPPAHPQSPALPMGTLEWSPTERERLSPHHVSQIETPSIKHP